MTDTLHEIIVQILTDKRKPMSVKEISDIIHRDRLWFRPSDGKLPSPSQVHARIREYPTIFLYSNSLVILKNKPDQKLKIFTRLISNENNWELPSFHKWRKEDQVKKNVSFENKYGFGHEEWLFNLRYLLNGYQYGYIRGIEHSRQDINQYEALCGI